jgi:hypothetical protein
VNLTHALQDILSAYLDGRMTLEQLRLWLAEHVQVLAGAGDPEAAHLADQVWILVSECDYGHREEEDVRAELRRELATVHTRYDHFNLSPMDEVQAASGNIRLESEAGEAQTAHLKAAWWSDRRPVAASA